MYGSIAELEDRVTAGILARYVTEEGDDRERVLEGYLSRASAHVDAAISARYATPVSAAAALPLLSDLALTFALWQIAADRGLAGKEIPEGFQKPYDNAAAMLLRIASGEVSLSGAESPSGASAGLRVKSARPVFGEGSPGMEFF